MRTVCDTVCACARAGTEDYFFYNIATGEAQWEEPDEYLISEENQLGLKEEDVMSQVEAEDHAVKAHRI